MFILPVAAPLGESTRHTCGTQLSMLVGVQTSTLVNATLHNMSSCTWHLIRMRIVLTPEPEIPDQRPLWCLCRYGLLPHRIAFWIYWHALVLALKGVPFFSPPPKAVLERAAEGATHPLIAPTGCPFAWRPAHGWPWDTWGESKRLGAGGGARKKGGY